MSHDKIYFFFIVVFLCNKKKCLAIAIKFNMYQIIEVCVIPFSERKGYILDKYTLGKYVKLVCLSKLIGKQHQLDQ
jgi:hypothetical protein